MLAPEIQKHKESFLSEARSHVKAMNTALVKLEKSPSDPKLLHEIFWAMHTSKSIAAAMGYVQTERLCHAMEDLLDAIKKKRLPLKGAADLLFVCFDHLEANLKALSEGREELVSSVLVERLRAHLETSSSRKRGSNSRPDSRFRGNDRGVEEEPPPAIEKIQRIEVNVERLDRMMNVAEELLVARMRLDRIRETLDNPELTAAVEMLGRLVSEMQYYVMQVRLVPVGFLFDRFPRMIRDLAKEQGKEVELLLEGSQIELDRSMIDEIGESLVHLLRNAVDHGLETPDARRKVGKSPSGVLRIAARRTKESVVIEVADDGQGLDLEAIKATALKAGLLAAGAAPEEVMQAIFSGVSTSAQVTAVSGRGLGLNIVKKKIESIGGFVKVSSTPGQGTTFRMEIPLTLAVIQTLFVEVGGRIYAIPVANVERLVTVNPEDLKGMLNYEEIVLDQEDVPVTRLNQLFGVDTPALAKQPIVVVRRGDERLGLAVDNPRSTQEVVVKPLNRVVRENRYFSGAAMIGSGEAILILDVANLILSKRQLKKKEVAS